MARVVCGWDFGNMSVSFIDNTGITPVEIKVSEEGVMKESVYKFTANHKNPIDLPRIMRENEGKNVIVIDLGKSIAILMRKGYYDFLAQKGEKILRRFDAPGAHGLVGINSDGCFCHGFSCGRTLESDFKGAANDYAAVYGTRRVTPEIWTDILPALRKLPPMPKPTKVKVIAFE